MFRTTSATTAGLAGSPRSAALRSLITAIVAAAAMIAAFGAFVHDAEAAQYVNTGSYDMRGFVATANPLYRCGTGYVGLGQMTARAPSNLGAVKAYATFYVQTTDSLGHWYVAKTGSPLPGGVTLQPGQSYTFPALSLLTGAGYYYAYAQIDFHFASGARIATVDVRPTVVGDWSASYRYQGDGYSYCYHA
jgi:hypothetical protein